jgi:hypothetical protein
MISPGWVYSPSRVRSPKHFVHLSQWQLTTSPKETKRTLLILKDYYSAWNGKVLLNKWKLLTFLKSSKANWTWQWKYYHWFTFFDLVNTYRQMWPFLFILYRPRIYCFPATIVFFFRTPDENDESRFHCILYEKRIALWTHSADECVLSVISKTHPFQKEFHQKYFEDIQRQKTERKLINIKHDKVSLSQT